jgi:hypothetical protein
MSTPHLQPDHDTLRKQIRKDMLVDLAGNLALALGLWGWFSEHGAVENVLHQPFVFIPLTATGILNLVHLPARLKRLREWQNHQKP